MQFEDGVGGHKGRSEVTRGGWRSPSLFICHCFLALCTYTGNLTTLSFKESTQNHIFIDIYTNN